MWLATITGVGLGLALRTGFHWLIRRGLRAPRVPHHTEPMALGLSAETIFITSKNQKQLFAWWLPCADQPRPTLLVMHGWGSNAALMLPLVTPLQQAGFHVLLLEARCHGRSEDDNFSSLPRFAEDIEAGLVWLKQHALCQHQPIALLGHSVGAGAALLVASRRRDVVAVVSVAAFTHPEIVMRRWLASKRIPMKPIGTYILRYVQKVIGYSFDNIAPIRSINKLRCPVLILHGEQDQTVPMSEAQALYQAAPFGLGQLRVSQGDHEGFTDMAAEAQAVVRFLRLHLDLQPPSSSPAQEQLVELL